MCSSWPASASSRDVVRGGRGGRGGRGRMKSCREQRDERERLLRPVAENGDVDSPPPDQIHAQRDELCVGEPPQGTSTSRPQALNVRRRGDRASPFVVSLVSAHSSQGSGSQVLFPTTWGMGD